MHFLQIVDDRKGKNVVREKCISSVKRFKTSKDKYTIKEIKYDSDPVKMVNEADKIRFTFAKENKDLFYVDTDCFLAALPDETQLKSNKIIMGETNAENGPKLDIFLFYVNGQQDFFLKNYSDLIERNSPFSLSPNQLRLFQDKAIPYEPLSYSHYSLTSLEININQQFNAISNRLIEAEKEINAYRNSVQGMVSTMELYNKLREKQGK